MAKFRVELEQTDWQLVLDLVQAGPYRTVAPLIGRLAEQLKVTPSPPPSKADGVDQPVEPVN